MATRSTFTRLLLAASTPRARDLRPSDSPPTLLAILIPSSSCSRGSLIAVWAEQRLMRSRSQWSAGALGWRSLLHRRV